MLLLPCRKQAAWANDFYLVGALLIIALLVATTGHAATATSQDVIPAGTTITNANWKQFARFMPIGMQTLFAGDHFWKMPKDSPMEVGPTIHIPLPLKYREDTERYRPHVKLKAFQDGGYTRANTSPAYLFRTRREIRCLYPTRSSMTPTIATRRGFNGPTLATTR